MFGLKKKKNTNNNTIVEMLPDVKFNMETILNDYLPYCTTKGKNKVVEIVIEYAQLNYNFKSTEILTDIDTIFHCFLLFNEEDSFKVRHKVHELTYFPQYFTINFDEQRKEAANEIRKMFPEYNMEHAIESLFPGYGNTEIH